jgi:hypothetical protein
MIKTPYLAVDGIIKLYDAKEVFIYKKDEIQLDKLVFDHKKIILDFLDEDKNLN